MDDMQAKEVIIDAEEYYSMRHKLFMIGETLVRQSKWEMSNEEAIETIRLIMQGKR